MEALLVEQSNTDQAISLRAALEQGGFHVTLVHNERDFAYEISAYWPNCVVVKPAETLGIAELKKTLDNTELAIPFIVIGKKLDNPPYDGNNVAFVDPVKSSDLSRSITRLVGSQKNRFFRLPDLTIDYHRQAMLRRGEMFTFTPKLFKLLDLFISHQNQVIGRKTIMKVIWETEYMGDTRTLDVHIRWLREKIEENPSKPKYLITVRGVGYCFMPTPG
jgi:DNA-binding response OmpR family regulator